MKLKNLKKSLVKKDLQESATSTIYQKPLKKFQLRYFQRYFPSTSFKLYKKMKNKIIYDGNANLKYSLCVDKSYR